MGPSSRPASARPLALRLNSLLVAFGSADFSQTSLFLTGIASSLFMFALVREVVGLTTTITTITRKAGLVNRCGMLSIELLSIATSCLHPFGYLLSSREGEVTLSEKLFLDIFAPQSTHQSVM